MNLLKIGAGAAALTAVIALAATIGMELPASKDDIRGLEQHFVQSDVFAIEEAIDNLQRRIWAREDRQDEQQSKGQQVSGASRDLLRSERDRLRKLQARLRKLQ